MLALLAILIMFAIPLCIVKSYDGDFKMLSWYMAILLLFTSIVGLPDRGAYNCMKMSVWFYAIYACVKYWKIDNFKMVILHVAIFLLFSKYIGLTRSDWQIIDAVVAVIFIINSMYYEYAEKLYHKKCY